MHRRVLRVSSASPADRVPAKGATRSRARAPHDPCVRCRPSTRRRHRAAPRGRGQTPRLPPTRTVHTRRGVRPIGIAGAARAARNPPTPSVLSRRQPLARRIGGGHVTLRTETARGSDLRGWRADWRGYYPLHRASLGSVTTREALIQRCGSSVFHLLCRLRTPLHRADPRRPKRTQLLPAEREVQRVSQTRASGIYHSLPPYTSDANAPVVQHNHLHLHLVFVASHGVCAVY